MTASCCQPAGCDDERWVHVPTSRKFACCAVSLSSNPLTNYVNDFTCAWSTLWTFLPDLCACLALQRTGRIRCLLTAACCISAIPTFLTGCVRCHAARSRFSLPTALLLLWPMDYASVISPGCQDLHSLTRLGSCSAPMHAVLCGKSYAQSLIQVQT